MIYCVEDDANIRELVAYTLQTMGFEAKEIEDGKALKKALAVELPELILLDIMLPGEDGLTLLKQLKADTLTRNIPVNWCSCTQSMKVSQREWSILALITSYREVFSRFFCTARPG